MIGQIVATGIFTLLGVVVGLFGERWVRTWGKVECKTDWQPVRGEVSPDSPGGVRFLERQLKVTFLNRKDVPVTVWDMRVVFYKGGNALDEEERPHMEFVGPGRTPLDLVNLPPRVPVTRTISVTPGHNETARQRAVEEADKVEFVAIMDGAKDIRRELAPWGQPA